MKHNFTKLVFLALACTFISNARAQVSLKNNLLYDAALTPNLGLEVRVAPKWTVALGAGLSPFELGDNSTRRWRHLLVMPEARYWFCEAYARHLISVNAVYSHFNAANLDLPLYDTGDTRWEGDFVGLGASYGFAIPFGKRRHWNIEFELGADLCYAWFDKYCDEHCGKPLGSDDKWFVLPKAGVNLAWIMPGKHFNPDRWNACKEPDTVEAIPYIAPTPFAPLVAMVQDNTGKAGELQRTNPVLEHISKYRPYDNTRVLRKEKGMLYVHFPLDKTTLLRDFRDNAPILDNIVDITRQIMADTTSSVKKIQIIGMASVEGPFDHNCDLGQGRAQALQDYVENILPETKGLYELNNGCEAWAEFEDQIKDLRSDVAAGRTPGAPGSATAVARNFRSNAAPTDGNGSTASNAQVPSLEDIDAVLNIIHSESDLNKREQQLRRLRGGKPYSYMRDNLLADQRNSGYLRIYYDYVPDEAARTINAATQLIQQGKYEEALQMLQGVRNDERAYNAYGVALYMTGHESAGEKYMRMAAEKGNQQAVENCRQLDVIRAQAAEQARLEAEYQARLAAKSKRR